MRFPFLRSMTVAVAAGVIAGMVVIGGLSFGLYGWPLFALAGLVGVAAGVPAGLWVRQRMRATPPIFRPESPTMDPDSARRQMNPFLRISYPPAPSQGQA